MVRRQSEQRRFNELLQSGRVVASEWASDHSLEEDGENFPSLSVSVYNSEGRLVASNRRTPLPNTAGKSNLGDQLAVSLHGGADTVVIGTSIAETENGLRQLGLVLAFLWVPLSILTAAIGWFSGGLVLKPVTELVESANRLSGLADNETLTTSDRAEFAALTESLNSLISRVRYSGKLQEQFAADAAHELRSPLAVLQTRIETALLRERRAEDYEDTLKAMLHSVDRMTSTVNALLMSARMVSVDAEPLELSERLAAFAGEWLNSTDWPPERLILSLQPCFARISPEELDIILRNVLDNAARFSPAASPIQVELKKAGSMIELTVRDFGFGIPAEERLAVFERLYRCDRSRGRQSGGAGIGLAVVKRFVNQLGGSARFANVEPGAMIVIELKAVSEAT